MKKKFRFASDYPVFSVATTRATLEKQLRLSGGEVRQLLENKSPQFGR